MHAGALAFRDDLTADEMRESAAVIQAKANEALTDLRGVLGVLRDTETGELLDRPQPTYADVAALVDAAREHGHAHRLHATCSTAEPPCRRGRAHRLPDRPGGPDQRAQARARGAGAGPAQRQPRTTGVDVLVRNPLGLRAAAARRAPGSAWSGSPSAPSCAAAGSSTARDGSTFVLHGWIPWAA